MLLIKKIRYCLIPALTMGRIHHLDIAPLKLMDDEVLRKCRAICDRWIFTISMLIQKNDGRGDFRELKSRG